MTARNRPTIASYVRRRFAYSTMGGIALSVECELVANNMLLPEEVRAEKIASGEHRYMNRINWACSALATARLLDRPSRGHYRITEDGRTVDRRNLASYS
ncbi:winged helix-turn-helix domain-containing protein [Flaviflexus huanghaiensis]|uniref:winged helix-turn-helix domain-containing protein n=1 Tax=Flaviflexus huanghaiensis TaxID=1111473 RepID=UPI001F512089|nr:winged helix-turn-helix domain-containing protein [Flaviflexus huanghaiensis]